MRLRSWPPAAAWRHGDARDGFETAWFHDTRVEGRSNAVEDGRIWSVEYRVELDPAGVTRVADVAGRGPAGAWRLRLDHDGTGNWQVDGAAAPALRGCLDVDLEASALTNAFPVRRMEAAVGDRVSCPAAYVHAAGPTVTRLEQTYVRLPDGPEGPRFDYGAPAFDFSCRLDYDACGLVLAYPGIAVRVA